MIYLNLERFIFRRQYFTNEKKNKSFNILYWHVVVTFRIKRFYNWNVKGFMLIDYKNLEKALLVGKETEGGFDWDKHISWRNTKARNYWCSIAFTVRFCYYKIDL